MPKLKIILAYDGTDYSGWQIQPAAHGKTIQGVVTSALKKLTGEEISLVAAGRTDAGVHARGQVISFNTASRIPVERWPLALNSVLPEDIVALKAEKVHEDFHARYDARRKQYRYTIYNERFPDVFSRRYSWQIPHPLDRDAMAKATKYFIGYHDFRSFCASGSSVKNFNRYVEQSKISYRGNFIYFDITANGFLYHMVRNIVGTLVEVGRQHIKPENIAEILAAKCRQKAGPTAPPQGLCLEKVDY
ncbi:MAG: tRNA pseudouridine38-40 synthase [Clostridia bacterium]|nr:tRNA pseudouridine38-40 synthase [Clostridia bacterium]